MKIQNILSEDFVPTRPAEGLRYDDLTTAQVRTLLRIANGQVDVDSANDQEFDIITDLADLGLLDDEYQLTKMGQTAAEIANKVGGSAEVVRAKQRQAKMDNGETATIDDIEVDGGNGDDEFEDDLSLDDESPEPATRKFSFDL